MTINYGHFFMIPVCNHFYGRISQMKHLISTKQFGSAKKLEEIFDLADYYQEHKLSTELKDKIIASLFYEPSTRTRLSFETAALRLGAQVISSENAKQFSSVAKGETLADTIKIISGYADAIILRHYEKGAARKASEISTIPIINAGDGIGEHPTQALLDVYTIKKELGRLDNLHIALVGDLLNGRTVHSLINLLRLSDSNILYLISPEELKLPDHLKVRNKINFIEKEELTNLGKLDVLYMTRIQKERFQIPEEYGKVKNRYHLDVKMMRKMKKNSIVMHPLPRVNEISTEIDNDSRAAYFRQAQNGLYIRMAILRLLLSSARP